MTSPVLYIVVPCYNEQEVLHETAKRLTAKLQDLISRQKIASDSRMLFVNDGSRDATWEIIEELCQDNGLVCGIKLSRNRGHQNALLAGLMTAKELCDCAISMDADLQDDIEAVDKFLEQYAAGCDVVYGVRSKRDTDTFFKRNSARGFYKFMKALGVDIVEDHADYRLLSRRALEGLSEFDEVNLFLRGIVPLIGFKSGTVTYERHERFAGESKYPLKKMLAFAFDGITSFSVKPIRLITTLGFVIFFVSILVLLYSLIVWLLGKTVTGWTTLAASIWLIGGIQLLCLGVIGEYIGKIYGEVKHRPRFIIETFLKQ
ncbi:glycosyltransferase family 2 protein [Oscillospiraceae bacterium NSJ-54]|uniref:Glycosyltransferase family 2 protein n=1 Tax=Zongyangia hominis TaxID=2763677 RepID=A0A926I6Y2_9FIRM|nr:glycosyltransferase family 2 protein [Zongyangia hominis]